MRGPARSGRRSAAAMRRGSSYSIAAFSARAAAAVQLVAGFVHGRPCRAAAWRAAPRRFSTAMKTACSRASCCCCRPAPTACGCSCWARRSHPKRCAGRCAATSRAEPFASVAVDEAASARLDVPGSGELPGAMARAFGTLGGRRPAVGRDDRAASALDAGAPMLSRGRALVAPAYLFACLVLGGSAQGIWQNMAPAAGRRRDHRLGGALDEAEPLVAPGAAAARHRHARDRRRRCCSSFRCRRACGRIWAARARLPRVSAALGLRRSRRAAVARARCGSSTRFSGSFRRWRCSARWCG